MRGALVARLLTRSGSDREDSAVYDHALDGKFGRRLATAVVATVALSLSPLVFGANVTERLTTLFVYMILAVMWNALAGYAGLVSVGQQMFFGLAAYATIRLSYLAAGLRGDPYRLGDVRLTSLPLSTFMLRLRGGEFAIASWVIATIAHLLVNFDPLIEGETGNL